MIINIQRRTVKMVVEKYIRSSNYLGLSISWSVHRKKNLGPKSSNSPDRRALYSYSWISIRGICFHLFTGAQSFSWK